MVLRFHAVMLSIALAIHYLFGLLASVYDMPRTTDPEWLAAIMFMVALVNVGLALVVPRKW